jgi:hypothetical protein
MIEQAWLRRDFPMESFVLDFPTRQLCLRFFDQDINIQSDSCNLIEIFAGMYRRFRVNDTWAPTQPPFVLTVLTRPENPWGTPVLIVDRDVWLIQDPSLLEGYVHYELLLKAVVTRVRSHVLIHAGVVRYGGQGIILAADSNHGKTTLVMELVRRGCQFLSDDVAALGRTDRQVHPFPRSFRIRPGTLELIGCTHLAARAPIWLGKLLVDAEDLRSESLGEAAAISHLVIVRDPADAEGKPLNGPERELGVLVHRWDEALFRAVSGIAGVTEVRIAVDYDYPLLWLCADRRMAVLSQIEALCQEQRILILDVIKRVESHPSFAAPARLEAIPKSQAVRELLRRFQGGHNSALLQEECGGSTTRLFMELAALVGQAKCYQLLVGPLREMADLVYGLVSTE